VSGQGLYKTNYGTVFPVFCTVMRPIMAPVQVKVYRIVINVPDVYMARYEVIFMRETSISRDIRRDGP